MSVFKDALSDHLTPAPFDQMVRISQPGMAHFAGTGPKGSTCRECIFWNHGPHDYRSKNGKYRGLIEPASCKKFQQITMNVGDKIRDDAQACKYFEANPSVPLRFAKAD